MTISVSSGTLKDVLPLRHSVLRPTQPPAACQFETDTERGVQHLVARERGLTVVGVATVGPADDPEHAELPAEAGRFVWRLRGMAVDPAYQGQGVGRQLLDACLATAAKGGADAVWCNARSGAAAFYTAAGFETLGREFVLPEIGPHVVMWRRVGRATSRR